MPHALQDQWTVANSDIVDILRFWATADDTPEELGQYLALAADEIAGLRAENEYLKKISDEQEQRS